MIPSWTLSSSFYSFVQRNCPSRREWCELQRGGAVLSCWSPSLARRCNSGLTAGSGNCRDALFSDSKVFHWVTEEGNTLSGLTSDLRKTNDDEGRDVYSVYMRFVQQRPKKNTQKRTDRVSGDGTRWHLLKGGVSHSGELLILPSLRLHNTTSRLHARFPPPPLVWCRSMAATFGDWLE